MSEQHGVGAGCAGAGREWERPTRVGRGHATALSADQTDTAQREFVHEVWREWLPLALVLALATLLLAFMFFAGALWEHARRPDAPAAPAAPGVVDVYGAIALEE